MAITETVPYNYNELYTSLQNKFAAANYDVAPGSNVSQLITAMAYFTSMLNVNTSANINETLLSQATTRDNAIVDARELGYEIQHKRSYMYDITLHLAGSSNNTYSIPKYTEFKENGKSYWYMGKQLDFALPPDVANPTVPPTKDITIPVIEGVLYHYKDFSDLTTTIAQVLDESGQLVPQSYVDIPFANIEDNGIECFVTYYDDFGNLVTNEQWAKSPQFMIDNDLIVVNKFFRMDNVKTRTPRIYFKIAGAGNGLRVGTTVNITALNSSGTLGAMSSPLSNVNITTALPNVAVTNATLITTGADEESLASIKHNAPRFYNSANRVVTANDYKAVCNRQSSVKDSVIWGGDDEMPKAPGHIWFSFLPSTLERIHTPTLYNQEFLLQNFSFTTWDYTLAPSVDPVNAPGPYEAQQIAAAAYYALRFIEDKEIKSTAADSSGNLIQPGIWNVLSNFQIPTLQFHNRHPFYLDFEYDLNIMKYDIVTSKSDIHQSVFNVIDNFFTGTNDTFAVERFGIEYFHSSLTKRIDSFLTDASGYHSALSTKILITEKNIASENVNQSYKDIFIPLAVPFESYFDANGYLLYNTLPNIDTSNFIDTRSQSDIVAGVPAPGTDLYTDWSNIQTQINNGVNQISETALIAPVRVKNSETIAGANSANITLAHPVYPDDPSIIDTNPQGTWPFTKTVVTKIVNGVESVLVHGTDWSINTALPFNPNLITLTTPLAVGESIRVDTNNQAGNYILFNSYKKYITVQLFVDASLIIGTSGQLYNIPASYLTTSDGLYDFTTDTKYLTTFGYSLSAASQANAITGPIIKTISPSTYTSSPLQYNLFKNDRYLNMRYSSNNFAVERNVMPRLKRVTFNG